jgi:hypothetical protein
VKCYDGIVNSDMEGDARIFHLNGMEVMMVDLEYEGRKKS